MVTVADGHTLAAPESPTAEKRVFLIFNPVSGMGDPVARRMALIDAFAAHGYTCDLMETTPELGARELAVRARDAGVEKVAVSGGDGTIREALSGLVDSRIPIAILPAGTGNLLAVNLGVPLGVSEAVKVALSGVPLPLDLARTDRGQYFAIMGGMGLDGKIMEEADRAAKDRYGVLAYVWATLKNLTRHRVSVRIYLDDRPPLYRRAKSVLVANMGKITGGLEAVPTAVPTDGTLDIGVVATHTFGEWLRLLFYSLMGRAHDDPAMEVFPARRVRIEAEAPEPVEFDGEALGARRRIVVEVVPAAVQILVPEGAQATRDAALTSAQAARQTARRRLQRALRVMALTALGVGATVYVARRRARSRR